MINKVFQSKSRIVFAVVGGLLILGSAVALILSQMLSCDSAKGTARSITNAAPVYGSKLTGNLTIGLVTSSQGPGRDFQLLAKGAHVVPSLCGKVKVIEEDDGGSSQGSTSAVNALIDQGATYIVYGSVGKHVSSGVEAAARRDVAVVFPYEENGDLISKHNNAFSLALSQDKVAKKLIDFSSAQRKYHRFAIISAQGDEYAQGQAQAFKDSISAQGGTLVTHLRTTAAQSTRELRAQLSDLSDSDPQAVLVVGDSSFTFNVAQTWFVLGKGAQMIISPRAATPAFGLLDASQIAPPVRSGTFTTQVAGGPWVQSNVIMNYFRTRDDAKKASHVDLSVADAVSGDAALLGVAAAEKAGDTRADSVLNAMSNLTFEGIAAGYSFDTRMGTNQDDFAIVAYVRQPLAHTASVGQRFPPVETHGGYFVAVPNTAPKVNDLALFE